MRRPPETFAWIYLILIGFSQLHNFVILTLTLAFDTKGTPGLELPSLHLDRLRAQSK
jgi:hypothetical protein